ncbi:MAG: 2-phosphosulfolactate phosphatase, partial [Meiothermus sp.]
MRLRIDLVPQAGLTYTDVVLVVDVIRATTTASAFLEAGARELYLTASRERFDYGNSPREALGAAVGGKTVVMSTTNGTKAAHLAASSARHVLLASLYNAHAAARLANDLASEEVAVLCAGKEGRIGLDDTYTAGVLAEFLQIMGNFELEDGALT